MRTRDLISNIITRYFKIYKTTKKLLKRDMLDDLYNQKRKLQRTQIESIPFELNPFTKLSDKKQELEWLKEHSLGFPSSTCIGLNSDEIQQDMIMVFIN
jgi:hypothetical protein